MGRAKLKLEKLEPGSSRNTTYTKRRHGLTKKVSELSILCDIDIMLLTFSPGGRPAFFKSEKSSIEEIIKKFAQLTPQERAQRKLESLEILKKAFKNLEHVINLKDPFGPDYHSAEDLTALAELLRARLSDINYNLSCWTYMNEIESIEQLAQMKESLGRSLNGIWNCKEILQRQQLDLQRTNQQNFEEQQMNTHSADQFQQGAYFPFDLDMDEERLQLLSWIEDHQKQNMDFQKDLCWLHHGDLGCSGIEGYPDIRTRDQIDTTTGFKHPFPMDIANATHEQGTSMDFVSSGHGYDILVNIGSFCEHDSSMDLFKHGNEDGFLVDLTDSGHGHAVVMDFAETDQSDTGQKYDITRELTRTKNVNGFPMDLMNIHPEHEMPLDLSQTTNEHGISMNVAKFSDDHGISMDMAKTAHEDVFLRGFIGTRDDYGTLMDLRTGDSLPRSLIKTRHEPCMPVICTEAGNQDGMFVNMLKDGNEFNIVNKIVRKENMDMQRYEEHPDQPFRFPLLCDNNIQVQEHLNMQENPMVSNIHNPPEFYEFGLNSSDCISGMGTFDEYSYPQLDYSPDNDDEPNYNGHMSFKASRRPIIVH